MRFKKPILIGCLAALLAVGLAWGIRAWSRAAERREVIGLIESKRFKEAIPRLRQFHERSPNDVETLELLIEGMIQSGALRADVLPYLSRLCELKPDDPLPFQLRMDALAALGRSRDALADARRVLELRPKEHNARRLAAHLLLDLGRFEECQEECQTLLKTAGSARQEVMTLLAQCQIGRDDLTAATATLDTILREKPGHESANLYRGVILLKQGKEEEAIGILKGLFNTSDSRVRQAALYHGAMAHTKVARDSEAKDLFEKLARDQRAIRFKDDARQLPNDRHLQVRAAAALLEANYTEDAVQLLEEAESRLGEWQDASKLLAEGLKRLGRKLRAEEVRRRLSRS